MTIHIEDLKFQTIIGILDFERTSSQAVIINIKIEYIYHKEFINYAEVASLIKMTMIQEKFLLIEDALSFLSETLKSKFPQIQKLNLKITKPSILPDCKVSVSEIYLFNS
jgi:dihydroneopterin aldolase